MRTLILCDRGPTQVALYETLQGSMLEVVGFVDRLARFIALAAESRPEFALIAGDPAGDRNTLESAKWALRDLGLKCAVVHLDGTIARELGYVVIVPPFSDAEIEAALRGESSPATSSVANSSGGSQAAVDAVLAGILSDGEDDESTGLDDVLDVGNERFEIGGIADLLEPPTEEELEAGQAEDSVPTSDPLDVDPADSSSVGIDVRDIFGRDEFTDAGFDGAGDLSAAFATLLANDDGDAEVEPNSDGGAQQPSPSSAIDVADTNKPIENATGADPAAAISLAELAGSGGRASRPSVDAKVAAAVPEGARSFRAVAESGASPVVSPGERNHGAHQFADVANAVADSSATLREAPSGGQPDFELSASAPPVPEPQRTPPANESTAPRVEGRDIKLQVPTSGTFEQIGAETVLFTLHILKATGAIQFSGSGLKVDLAVCDGEFGLAGRAPSTRDRARLTGAFAWTTGTFRFTPSPQRNFQPLDSALGLIELACARHIAFEKIAMSVSADMNRYPVRTQRTGLAESEGLRAWLDLVDGQRTLASLLIPTAAVQGEELRHAYFAALTGMVVYFEQPTPVQVVVTYNAGGTQRPSSPSGESEGEMLDEHVFERDPSIRKDDSSDVDQIDLDEMRERSRRWKSGGDYVVFGLEPGCGFEAVSKRYYEMVKTHHPDVYASRRSKELKRVAERLFMQMQRSFSNLRRAETAPAASVNRVENVVRAPRVEPPPARSQPELRQAIPTRQRSASPVAGTENRRVRPTTSRLSAVRNRPSGATSAVTSSVKPDQLVIQARRAARESQYENVAKMIGQAVAAGYTNFDTAALGPLSAYMIKDLGGAEARKAIEEAREVSSTPIEESRLETYLGHVARMESDQRTADKHYRRAARLDPDNLEAVRWTRHLHRQKADAQKGSERGLFGGLFQKKKK